MRKGFTTQGWCDQNGRFITFKHCLVSITNNLAIILRPLKFLLCKLSAKVDKIAGDLAYTGGIMIFGLSVPGGIEARGNGPCHYR